MPGVFVTDASERAALAVIRSLGRQGVEVTAGDCTSLNAGFLSKYCKRSFLYPSPEMQSESFLEAILEHVKANEYDLLIPITDFTAMPLSKHKDEFAPYVNVAMPRFEVALSAFDKTSTIAIADREGIPHPKTFMVSSLGQVRKMAEEMTYPVVIKPRTSIVWTKSHAVKLKITAENYAQSKTELVAKYTSIFKKLKRLGVEDQLPFVQAYVRGQGYGVEALIHDSKPVAVFTHRRLREYPITGGASTLRESVKNSNLAHLGIKLLKGMDWDGVAMVEFRVDPNTGKPMLIEVNGRFWGSLPLAISAGVNFPYLLYQVMRKETPPNQRSYAIGLRHKWLLPGDLLWLLASVGSRKNVMKHVAEFMSSLLVPDDIMTLGDLRPTIGAFRSSLAYSIDVLARRRSVVGESI